MSIDGNLSFTANVAPFEKPFPALLSNLIFGRKKSDLIEVDEITCMGLRVWQKTLVLNRGSEDYLTVSY